MRYQEFTTEQKPVILLVTRRLKPVDLSSDLDFAQLRSRFDIRLVDSPTLALSLSQTVRDDNGRVALFLSDMMTDGSDVLQFIMKFNTEWPEAGVHFFDAIEGRVIFTKPQAPDSPQAAPIHVEANGHDFLDSKIVNGIIKFHFPEENRTVEAVSSPLAR